MYYTDSEIYRAIRRGVEISVLAQLNNCDKNAIKNAYTRYKQSLDEVEDHYNQILEKHRMNNISAYGSSIGYDSHLIPKAKTDNAVNAKIKYSDEMIETIKSKLKSGESYKQIYAELFEDTDFKPSYKNFSNRCARLKKKLGLI